MTKVSIIIPVYNLEKYLERCLQSVLNQSLKDIEVLCINDASTDNSLLILEKYRNQDKRIKVHTINKSGQGVARNTGIKMATGEYIGFVDGDDAIEPNMYEELYNTAINNNSEITFCHTNCFYNDKKIKLYNYEKEKKKFWHTNTNIHFSHSEIIPFLSYVTVVCWNKIYKKTLLDSTDALFEPYTYDEDIPFFFITMLNANKITVIRKALYRHYVGRSDSSSNTYSGNVARIANIFNTTEKKIKI